MKTTPSALRYGQRIKAMEQPDPSDEPQLTQALRAVGETLRAAANLVDAIAMSNEVGGNNDLLKPSDVARLLRCGESKARQIVRAHGTGQGKMGRIERGRLMQLQREGRL